MNDQPLTMGKVTLMFESTLQQLANVIDGKVQPVIETIKEVHDLCKSLKIKVEELESNQNLLIKKNEELEKRIQNLEQNGQSPIITEKKDIKLIEEWDKTRKVLSDIEQSTGDGNVEIVGIPVKEKEDLKDLIIKIGDSVRYPIKEEEIENAFQNQIKYRIFSLNLFLEMSKSNLWKKLKGKPLSTDMLGVKGKRGIIYLNENLTNYKKKLFYQARILKKEKEFMFAWSKNGNIYLRKTKTSKVFHIQNEDDIEKIKEIGI